jgi:ABC-type spermidine/putrescine transport system permease subunit II
MPRSFYQRFLGLIGKLVVFVVLGFLVLPVAVVTVAAFNDKAILSFPPQAVPAVSSFIKATACGRRSCATLPAP